MLSQSRLGPLGILRRQNLNSVAVLYFIVNIDQFSVYSCPYHLIAHGAVNRIGKINRRGTVWQVLYISIRSKTVHIFREQIQITFERLKNSRLSDMSLCHSRIWRSQFSFAS